MSQPQYYQPPPQQAAYGAQAPVPPKKRRVWPWILAIVVLVVCGGGAAAIYFVLNKAADIVDTATNTRVVTPETFGGKAKITNPSLTATLDSVKAKMQLEVPNSTGAVAAAYGDVAKSDIVLVTALSGVIANPQSELDSMFKAVTGTGSTMVDVAAVEAGPFGGVAKCGTLKGADTNMAVCGWADNGSVGMIIWFEKPLESVKGDFVAMRGQIETRN